jgi:hypothetical protein
MFVSLRISGAALLARLFSTILMLEQSWNNPGLEQSWLPFAGTAVYMSDIARGC